MVNGVIGSGGSGVDFWLAPLFLSGSGRTFYPPVSGYYIRVNFRGPRADFPIATKKCGQEKHISRFDQTHDIFRSKKVETGGNGWRLKFSVGSGRAENGRVGLKTVGSGWETSTRPLTDDTSCL